MKNVAIAVGVMCGMSYLSYGNSLQGQAVDVKHIPQQQAPLVVEKVVYRDRVIQAEPIVKTVYVSRGASTLSNAQKLNRLLGGKLKGKGELIEKLCATRNINPLVMGAITMHETGNGTSVAIQRQNNVGGLMGDNGLMTYSSVDESLKHMADILKRYYIDEGLNSIDAIQKKYCPVGAKNDPKGLNKHWKDGVWSYYNKLKNQ